MKFILGVMMLVVLAGFFHFMFIFVDYGYNHPTKGGFSIAYNLVNETLNTQYGNWLYNHSVMYKQFFGLGRVIVVGVIIVAVVLYVITGKKQKEE